MMSERQPTRDPHAEQRNKFEAPSFVDLIDRVNACTICTNMHHVHVLSDRNGPAPAPIMFIGEAVGRLGGARTGVPMTNDATGRRFQTLLHAAGLVRERVFITNAVLCNPLREGRNRRPARTEIAACAEHLRDQIAIVDPAFVVTMGEVALSATELIEPHGRTLRADVGRPAPWLGRTLLPLYHPGPRAILHRPHERQVEDWIRLGALVLSTFPELSGQS